MKSETIEYRDGDLLLKGFVAFDDSKAGKRPGILVNPEAFGLGPFARSRAERLAQLGYVALAADPFGGGRLAVDPDEAIRMRLSHPPHSPSFFVLIGESLKNRARGREILSLRWNQRALKNRCASRKLKSANIDGEGPRGWAG